MGIFNLIIIIPVILLYLSIGWIYLKLARKPVNRKNLLVFVISGGIGGITSLIAYGLIAILLTGKLDNVIEIIGMFLFSGIIALVSSIIFTNITIRSSCDLANRSAT